MNICIVLRDENKLTQHFGSLQMYADMLNALSRPLEMLNDTIIGDNIRKNFLFMSAKMIALELVAQNINLTAK